MRVEQTHTVDGVDYEILIDNWITYITYPHKQGVRNRVKIVTFLPSDETQRIELHYFLQKIDSDGEVITQSRDKRELSKWDSDYFDSTLGQVIRTAIVDGLFKYVLEIPKFFNPIEDDPALINNEELLNE